ncbi:MAG: S-layer homology domain-containing protein [Clostridia bacterium]|nr:S-layer homology domain-containing protein [Clostridia bacterium]
MRKYIAILLSVLLLSFVLPVICSAEVKNIIENGTFEAVNAQNMPSGWTLKDGEWGVDAEFDTVSNSGLRAVRFYGKGESVYMTQEIRGIIGGTEYSFSGYVKVVSAEKTGAMVKLEWRSYDKDGNRTVLDSVDKKQSTSTGGAFKNLTLTATAPKNANAVNVLIRLVGGGDVTWDDVTFWGELDEGNDEETPALPEKPAENVSPPLSGEKEKVINGGFESLHPNGRPENWERIYKGEWQGDGLVSWDGNPYVRLSTDVVHSGENALCITTQTKGNPWCLQEIGGLTPGAIYQISAWINSTDADQIGFKFEFDSTYGSKNTDRYLGTGGAWKQICETVTIPDDTTSVRILARLFSNGTAYYDDISFYKVAESPRFYADSDEVFYYSDLTGVGKVHVRKNLMYYPEDATNTYTVNFFLSDGETLLFGSESKLAGEETKISFDLALLKEKQKAYTAAVTVEDAAGENVFTESWSVYKYERPAMMTKEGQFIVDGKEFNPIYVYHAKTNEYPDVAKMGITLVQGSGGKDIDAMETQLDAAHEAGLKVMLPLYSNMKAAGHPDKAELTTNIIKRLKNHPAVFAWMIQDEPHLYQETNKYLEASYKLIRELDPVHPCFIMENKEYYFDQTYKYTDIMGIDVYPKGNHPAKYVAEHARLALEASAYRKPVYTLLQCYTHGGWTPTDDDVRNMIYQALFVGSSAIGYYAMDAEPFNEYVDVLTSFYEKEAADMYDYFVRKKYPRFAVYQDDAVWYESFVKDGSVCFVVANRSEKNTYNTSIDLVSDDGSVRLGGYTAELVAGDRESAVSGSGQLAVSLAPSAVQVYKITSSPGINLVPQTAGKLVDSVDVSWAENEIEKIHSLGIANTKGGKAFAPREKITRGEFAMFLVRTLGLSAQAGENFADVTDSMPYAKELAVGKTAGILQGDAKGNFKPEEEVSRREALLFCARGLHCVKTQNSTMVAESTDAELLADSDILKLAEVARICLTRGKADGTLQFPENMTRAEAAVMMSVMAEQQNGQKTELLSEEECRDAVGALLSEGIYKNETLWYTFYNNEQSLVVQNAGEEEKTFSIPVNAVSAELLNSETTAVLENGNFSVRLRSGETVIVHLSAVRPMGLYIGNVSYRVVKDKTVTFYSDKGGYCAAYRMDGNTEELVCLFTNGAAFSPSETEACTVKIFAWNGMDPQEERRTFEILNEKKE